MRYSRFAPAMQARTAWNAGTTVGTKRPLTQKQIWAIRFHLDREGRLRDKALFDLAIDSKLRGCDLVKIKIGDVIAGADLSAATRSRTEPGMLKPLNPWVDEVLSVGLGRPAPVA